MGLFDEGTNFLSRFRHATGSARPPLEAAYVYILAALIGYSVADLSVLGIRPMMLPKEAPPSRPKRRAPVNKSDSNFMSITQRNLFNADGKIPPPLSSGEDPGQNQGLDGPAVPSKLPLKLLGTIVHVNNQKSVATINMTSKNDTQSFKVDDEIPGMAKVTRVERRKVIFRNRSNGRLEYIEIPEDAKITFGVSAAKEAAPSGDEEVAKTGEFEFTIDRNTLSKYTSDLSKILKQARMVPNVIPGSGGQVEGFRFVNIQPGSIFGKLGFQPGDIIKEVNDDTVNSPSKAMELYNALKTSDQVQLKVERNGRDENFRYSIQ